MKKLSVSIVIPNYNGIKLLEKNLPKVIKAAKGAEIIVVDDASTDKSAGFLKDNFPKVKVIKHGENKRFAEACNTGVNAAEGNIVVLLNNDVFPKANFLEPLVRRFEDNLVFSVGCKEVEVKNNKKIISGRTEGKFERGFLVHFRPKDQTSPDTLWTFGGSMAVDKKKYFLLGGMDKMFAPAYWEDVDLSWRAKKMGWKILFEKKSVVFHNHETTNIKELGKKKMELLAFRNQILFVWKNIRGWQLFEHFIFLPYHLIFTSIRTRGIFLAAFFQAVWRYFTHNMF